MHLNIKKRKEKKYIYTTTKHAENAATRNEICLLFMIKNYDFSFSFSVCCLLYKKNTFYFSCLTYWKQKGVTLTWWKKCNPSFYFLSSYRLHIFILQVFLLPHCNFFFSSFYHSFYLPSTKFTEACSVPRPRTASCLLIMSCLLSFLPYPFISNYFPSL